MKKLILLLFFPLFVVIALAGFDQVQIYGLPSAIQVTKSDTTIYNPPLRALFFSATAAQTLTVDMAGSGTGILFTYGTAGTYLLPAEVSKVYSTGTSVTGIVGFREQTVGPTYPTPTATPSVTASPTPSATWTPPSTPTATSTITPTPTVSP